MKYCILNTYSIKEIEEEMKHYIKQGWKPQGGISVVDQGNTRQGRGVLFCQAVIKE